MPTRPARKRRPTVAKRELMPDGNDRVFRHFVHDLLAFSTRAAEVRAGFGRHLGLSGIGYTTLISIAYLQDDESGIGISGIAAHLHLSGAFVTIEVAKLVRSGLVEKRINTADRRRVLLTVTEDGRRLLDDLAPLQAPVNDALFGTLSKQEFRQLADLMGRLVGCGNDALALLAFLTRGGPSGERTSPQDRSAVRRKALSAARIDAVTAAARDDHP